jgi:FkbM family methyltransferase
VRRLPRNVLSLRRAEILRSGGVNVLVDCGAADGEWAAAARAAGYRGRIVSYEPRGDAYAQLERRCSADPAWTCARVALADHAGQAELHLSATPQASSLLPLAEHLERAPGSAAVGVEPVTLARLDDVLSLAEGERAYLKADVQGAELAVLDGARRTLGSCDWVELEVAFAELYEGQPLAHDVLARLWREGFAVGMLETNWRDRQSGDLISGNVLFRRR